MLIKTSQLLHYVNSLRMSYSMKPFCHRKDWDKQKRGLHSCFSCHLLSQFLGIHLLSKEESKTNSTMLTVSDNASISSFFLTLQRLRGLWRGPGHCRQRWFYSYCTLQGTQTTSWTQWKPQTDLPQSLWEDLHTQYCNFLLLLVRFLAIMLQLGF